MSDPQNDKHQLLRQLAAVPSHAKQVMEFGQQLVQSAQLAQDIAVPLHDFVSCMPENQFASGQLQGQVQNWRRGKTPQ